METSTNKHANWRSQYYCRDRRKPHQSEEKNHAERILAQQWVLGGICRESREYFMEIVPDRSAATPLPIITRRVKAGTTIITDEWHA